jgi:hypothetical protein
MMREVELQPSAPRRAIAHPSRLLGASPKLEWFVYRSRPPSGEIAGRPGLISLPFLNGSETSS